MLDGMMNKMADFASKVAKWIKLPTIDWTQFMGYWNQFVDTVGPWNQIFPVSDAITIIGLILAFLLVLMVLWTIELIKSFIPMSGGK